MLFQVHSNANDCAENYYRSNLLTYPNRTIPVKKLAHAALNFQTESSFNDLKSTKKINLQVVRLSKKS